MQKRILLTLFGLLTALALTQSAQAQTSVTHCGQTLNAAGVYVLTTDLDCSGTSGDYNGVSITASNVVFHLAGHIITGNDCDLNRNISGIFVAGGLTGVKIEGGTVVGFNDGVLLSSSNSKVIGMTVRNACAFGILAQGRNNQIKRNVVKASGDGVALVPSRNTRVASNDLSGNVRAGVVVSDFADGNFIENNILNNNGSNGEGYGIAVFNGTNNTIRHNTANKNDYGIRISASNNTVIGNTVSGSNYTGIWVLSGAASSISRNTVFGSGETDLFDENSGCNANSWLNNKFITDLVARVPDGGPNAGCIR